MADRFTADRMAWLERVQDDREVNSAAFAVAFAISRHLNRRTGEAWPSQGALGAMVGVSDRHVRTLLSMLVDRGHLTIMSGGFQKPDRYRPTSPDWNSSSAINPEPQFRSEEDQDRNHSSALEPANDHLSEAPDRNSSSAQTGTTVPPNPLSEPFEEERANALSTRGRAFEGSIADAFATWWSVYPKRERRIAAEKKFRQVIRSGLATADELIEAAERYAASGKVARGYAQSPVNWLNDGSWADEPEAARNPHTAFPGAAYSGLQHALSEIAHDQTDRVPIDPVAEEPCHVAITSRRPF